MEAGPTYLLIVTICCLSVLGSFVIFKDKDEVIPLIFSAIVAVCGLAYGIQVRNNVKS